MPELTEGDAKRARNCDSLRRIITLIEKKHEKFSVKNSPGDGSYTNIAYSRGFMYYHGYINAHASNYITTSGEAYNHRGIKISCSMQSESIECTEVGITNEILCNFSCPDHEEANLDKLASEILHYLSNGKIPKNKE